MDVASGIFAAVSLSFQLAQSVKSANGVLRDVRNAPDELARLTGALDQLELLLIQVKVYIEQQSRSESLPGSIGLVQSALVTCESTIDRLTKLANTLQASFERPGRLQKLWASVKTVLRREDLARLHSQVDENMRNLQISVLINMSHLQLRQMQLMSNTHVPNTSPPQQGLITDAENKYTGRNELSRAKPDLLTSSGQTSVLFYKGLFGSIRIQTRTRMEKTSCDKAKRAISRSKSIVIAPSFARSVFELRSEDCLGHMSRTVTSFPVLPHEAEIFNWFHSNKFDRIIDALNRREISPFVRDPRGWTLLHYACFTSSVEICSMLIQVGVDVDHQDYGVCKAMSFIEVNSRGKNKASLEDLTRAVLSAQDDITLADISTFFWAYLWLSQWCQLSVVADFLTSTFTLCSYPSWGYDSYEWCLRIALSEWGRGDRDKRVVVRKLLCQGINIHAIETSEHVNHIVPVRESDVLTPLDYLFQSLTDPFCNDGIGREWLLMLAEVGYDVRAYLEKEKKLHASQCLRTSEAYVKNGNTCDLCSRQLIFQIGSYPNVRWDWWIDPSSAASLVRKEFRYINIRNTLSDSWEDTWPFEYPAWSEYCEPIGHMYPVESDTAKRTACEQKVALARSRLARRARKKYPDYYSKQNPMPGAWVEDVFEG